MTSVDDEWENFINNNEEDNEIFVSRDEVETNHNNIIPECSEIKISTKTKIIYLNKEIDLYSLFWKLKTIDYMDLKEGILKKQIKYNFNSKDEIKEIEEKIKNEKNVSIKIIKQVDNPSGRVKFKDIRKLCIPMRKDI